VDCDQSALLTDLHAGKHVWSDVYICCRERMYRAAARVLRFGDADGQSADDFVDEAFTVAMKDGVANVHTNICGWLTKSANGRAIDACRRASRGRELDRRVADLLPAADVADLAELASMAELAEEALLTLPPPEQYVMREQVMKQRPVKDVAGDLDCAPQRISQLRTQALRRLAAAPGFAGGTVGGLDI
jgi:RNA polymerase sigma factor (sigma-70 family)